MKLMGKRARRRKRNKSDWGNMTISELQRRMAHRIARIEVLNMEINELKRLIKQKMKFK